MTPPDPFMIEMPSGEIVTVVAMYDEEGDEVQDRSQAREFGVVRENGKEARLKLRPEWDITKVERQ